MAPPAFRRRHSLSTTGLVPVAVDRAVEVPVKVPRPEHRGAMAHAHRLEAVPEAAGFGRLHESHTGQRRGHNGPKNKSHDGTSVDCTFSDKPVRNPKISLESPRM